MKKIAFHNLGCKVNTYELDAMMQMLIDEGYQQVPFEETADIYIINTYIRPINILSTFIPVLLLILLIEKADR